MHVADVTSKAHDLWQAMHLPAMISYVKKVNIKLYKLRKYKFTIFLYINFLKIKHIKSI